MEQGMEAVMAVLLAQDAERAAARSAAVSNGAGLVIMMSRVRSVAKRGTRAELLPVPAPSTRGPRP